jgi:dienelactone hydrolase
VFTATTGEYREHVVLWIAEMHQSLDYLQSRDDVDPGKIAYQGISLGSTWAPHFLALEPRLKAGVLIEGGVPIMQSRARPYPPELQLLNFAPRVKVPVLMLNGRQDAIFPYETSQLPLFRALGSPEALKRHATFPGGHDTFGWRDELYRESLDWLDRHVGPVTSR